MGKGSTKLRCECPRDNEMMLYEDQLIKCPHIPAQETPLESQELVQKSIVVSSRLGPSRQLREGRKRKREELTRQVDESGAHTDSKGR